MLLAVVGEVLVPVLQGGDLVLLLAVPGQHEGAGVAGGHVHRIAAGYQSCQLAVLAQTWLCLHWGRSSGPYLRPLQATLWSPIIFAVDQT